MTKEELKQEAEEWIGRNKPVQDDWEDSDIIQAIVDTNEKREKRIEELEAQIEKMKCCENCKHSNTTCECYTICTIGHYDDCKSNTVLDSLDKKDYWEN